MKNKKSTYKKTAQYQLTKRFLAILLGILLVINLIFIIASIGFVYDYIEDRTSSIIDSIKQGQEFEHDWSKLVNAYISDEDDDALMITLNSGEIYYSENAKEILTDVSNGKIIPILDGIIISDEGIYYVTKEEFDMFTIDLAINGESVIELASGNFLISIVLNLIAIIIGGLLIYWSVGKWSRKLSTMSYEISTIENSGNQYLTVPEEPIEIQEVAVTFNQLLKDQRESIEREKQFITDASHELRTPLAAIRGHVQLIKRRGENHPEIIPTSIDFIDKESQRLKVLSNQLLTLEKNDFNESIESLNISELVLHEIEKLQIVSQQMIIHSIQENILMTVIKGDIQQIVQNIVENALKYSDNEESIQVTLIETKDTIELVVSDKGIGIPNEKKEKIFERFYRVEDSRSSEIEGSGIGLSIVKKLVEKYDGNIIVKDNQDKGTVFSIIFPKRT